MSKSVVVKSNSFIETRGHLDIKESRIMSWAIAQIEKDDEDFKMYQINRQTMLSLLGFESGTTLGSIERLFEKMRVHSVELVDPARDLGKDGWCRVGLISAHQYNSKTEIFSFSLAPELKPYLLGLKKHFTKLDFPVLIGFKLSHTFRLYEICKKELMGESAVSFSRDLEEFKRTLGVVGKYERYLNLKKRVLEPAIKELKEIAEIELAIHPSRMGGRKYKSLDFNVQVKNEVKTDLWLQLRSFGLSDEKISEVIMQYGASKVKLILQKWGNQLADGKFTNGTKIQSISGFFLSRFAGS